MPGVPRVAGREMMRIQGVYTYMINSFGKVGAFLGFNGFTVNTIEDEDDHHPVRGFVKIDRWVYPLLRSFSPIYCWGPDRLIFPDPFAPLDAPIYIVVRLPFLMSPGQKAMLFNLLDTMGHVTGRFNCATIENKLADDKKYVLTNITPWDRFNTQKCEKLKKNEWGNDKPVIQTGNITAEVHRRQGKMFRCGNIAACPHKHDFCSHPKLRLCMNTQLKTSMLERLQKCRTDYGSTSSVENKALKKAGNRRKSPHPKAGHEEFYGSLTNHREENDLNPKAGGLGEFTLLPPNRGNLMRLYVLGPRDKQHIRINMCKEWISVPYVLFGALREAFHNMVLVRSEKEKAGVPPSFMHPKMLTRYGFGQASYINKFGPGWPSPLTTETTPQLAASRAHENPPQHLKPICLTIQDLERASQQFDIAMATDQLELISVELIQERTDFDKRLLLNCMVPTEVVVRFRRISTKFAEMNMLSYTVSNDIFYTKNGPYIKRHLEDCEHHYPKLRPRNPMTDPKYEFSRLAPVYSTVQ